MRRGKKERVDCKGEGEGELGIKVGIGGIFRKGSSSMDTVRSL